MKRVVLKSWLTLVTALAMCAGNGLQASAAVNESYPDRIGAGIGTMLMETTDSGASVEIPIDENTFPDETFRNFISEDIDGEMIDGDSKDGKLSAQEISAVVHIYVDDMGINSLEGIKVFTELQELYCNDNELTALDVSGLDKLVYLECYRNQLTSLDVSGLSALETLRCSSNQLTNLNVGGLTALTFLNCSKNNLTSLDVSMLQSLETLYCQYNQLTSLNLGKLAALTYLDCDNNKLKTLDVKGLKGLTNLNCSQNELIALDASGLTALEYLYCDYNSLESLNVTGLTSLLKLDCCLNTSLKSLDVSSLTSLTSLNCYFCDLTSLDLSNLTNLVNLNCGFNSQITSLDVSKTKLTSLLCDYCALTELKVNTLTEMYELDCSRNKITELNIDGLTELKELRCFSNQLTSLDVSDATNLQTLHCEDNSFSSLDVSALTKLDDLYCDNVLLTGLDLSEDTYLRSVEIHVSERQCNLSNIIGLNLAKLEISDGTVSGSLLIPDEDDNTVTFTYDCASEASSGSAHTVDFTIIYREPEDSNGDEDNDSDTVQHNYSETWTIDISPTCTQPGSKSRHCTEAGCDSRTDVTEIPAVGHSITLQTTPATMTEDGSIVKKCNVCGTVEESQTIYRISKVTLSKTSFTYSGKVQKPKVTVKDSQGVTLSTDCYDVKYGTGCKAVGKYTVEITFKGNYSGNTCLTYSICPKTTSISKVTAKKKGFVLQWKKVSTQTTGYQIQYSTSKTFKNAKTIDVKKNKTTSKTISKLKAKKTYYVRVRTYKVVKVNGKNQKIYSGWSKVKTIKTKK